MLGNTLVLAYNATPDNTTYTAVSAGELSTVRKDLAITRAAVYTSRTNKISQQYNADGSRRVLIRFDQVPVATDEVPKPRKMSAYIVFDFDDNVAADKVAMREFTVEMSSLINTANMDKILAGEF